MESFVKSLNVQALEDLQNAEEELHESRGGEDHLSFSRREVD
jgi:hypothetical protein